MIYLMKKDAFTLVEMMVVIIILSVLASIAFPKYTSVIEKTYTKNAEQTLLEIYGAQKRYFIDNDDYAVNMLDLDIRPRRDKFKAPIACSNSDPTDACASNGSIAEIERDSTNPHYTLMMAQNLEITCNGSTPAGICSQLGF